MSTTNINNLNKHLLLIDNSINNNNNNNNQTFETSNYKANIVKNSDNCFVSSSNNIAMIEKNKCAKTIQDLFRKRLEDKRRHNIGNLYIFYI